jgi:hypothetical protein
MRALRMWKVSDELNAELMLDLLPEPDRGLLPPRCSPAKVAIHPMIFSMIARPMP